MGMNAAFSLNVQLCMGENLLIVVATATALFIPALPAPPALQILRSMPSDDEEHKQVCVCVCMSVCVNVCM